MTNSKNTKRALLLSVLSMMLCAAMLIGSTFAWFTDSVTSSKNKIVAGNLDVELTHTNAKVNDEEVGPTTKLFTDKEGGEIRWEPGVMAYENFTVKNVGSLALKYTLSLNVSAFNTINGKSLKDVLKVALVEDGFSGDRTAALDLEYNKTIEEFEHKGNMIAGAEDKTYGIVIYWEPSDVDNDYNLNNGRKADDNTDQLHIDLGINLSAWQDTVEYDSFGNNYDEKADDPFALADAAALAANPKNAFRDAGGNYWQYASKDSERGLLPYLLSKSMGATLIRDIGQPSTSTSGGGGNYSDNQAVLDLNGHSYTFGMIELKQDSNTEAQNTSLVVKDGTMVGTINFEDILESYNAMKTVTLDGVTMKWENPLAWDAKKPNYYGLNLAANVSGTAFTVKNSVLNCNAQFYTTTDSELAERPVANLTNTIINGRLTGQSLAMDVDGCTVNGEVYCNASNNGPTTISIRNSTINGNAFFDANSYQENNVKITNTTITGNLQTSSTRDNVHITLTDVTVKGALSYTNSSWAVPASKVTIVSGTYGFDPTNYLADGSTATDNGNGTWTVTAS